MTNEIPETTKSPRRIKAFLLDSLRIFILSLFICVFSCFIVYAYMNLNSQLRNYLPGTGIVSLLREFILFLIFAIPFTAIVYLLVKSLKHFFCYWWIQLIVCGGFGVSIWWLYQIAEGWGVVLPMVLAMGSGIALVSEFFVLFLRSAVCMVIHESKQRRFLGWRFLIGSILIVLLFFVYIRFFILYF